MTRCLAGRGLSPVRFRDERAGGFALSLPRRQERAPRDFVLSRANSHIGLSVGPAMTKGSPSVLMRTVSRLADAAGPVGCAYRPAGPRDAHLSVWRKGRPHSRSRKRGMTVRTGVRCEPGRDVVGAERSASGAARSLAVPRHPCEYGPPESRPGGRIRPNREQALPHWGRRGDDQESAPNVHSYGPAVAGVEAPAPSSAASPESVDACTRPSLNRSIFSASRSEAEPGFRSRRLM